MSIAMGSYGYVSMVSIGYKGRADGQKYVTKLFQNPEDALIHLVYDPMGSYRRKGVEPLRCDFLRANVSEILARSSHKKISDYLRRYAK